ncbi:hypothetical protein SEA_GUDMIT_42 [Gordonia phage Gudmit]|nr:hypothetical protein SEA_GUDMIT_42 [Gordonia phage Gudmit]
MNIHTITDELHAPLDTYREPTSFEKAVLFGLQSKHVYQGTVPEAVVADRRRKNKAARKSRRINRIRSNA